MAKVYESQSDDATRSRQSLAALVVNFLVVKGVSPKIADKGRKTLEPADVADIAKAFTVQVSCEGQ